MRLVRHTVGKLILFLARISIKRMNYEVNLLSVFSNTCLVLVDKLEL